MLLNYIGRTCLLVVAGLLIGFAIPSLITSLQALNAMGWNLTSMEALFQLTMLIISGLNILIGLPALFGCIRGKGGFGLFLMALISAGLVVWSVIITANAGGFADPNNIWRVVVDCIVPILYFAGWLLLFIWKKD